MISTRHTHSRARNCFRRPRSLAAPPASSDVLALIAHDLRLPLAALRLSSEMALDTDSSSGEQHRLLETVYRQVDALERLTLDLLDAFADGRIAAGQAGTLDLNALADEVVTEFTEALGGRRAIALESDGPAFARGDAAKLRVALRNLVGNALKYSPDDSTVMVRVRTGGGQSIVAVEDRGAGIAADEIGHIFEREYRADSGRRRAPGHGLGLFIARQIVEAHGGAITVASAPGAGSTFSLALPQAADQPQDAPCLAGGD